MSLQTFRAELHIHTVLSPCAEIEMLPPLIIQSAREKGIQIIAISDHNASANIQAVQKAAIGSGICVLPGMELQTREDVHVLCLFSALEQVNAFQKIIDAHLPGLKNSPEHFGIQIEVDQNGEVIQEEERLLLTSTSLTLEEAQQHVAALEGLFIPAHVNRKAFGLIETLGFVPSDLPVDAVEISAHIKPDQARFKFPQLTGYPLIRSGDAHRLDEMAGFNQFTIMEPTLSEIRMALLGIDSRSLALVDL